MKPDSPQKSSVSLRHQDLAGTGQKSSFTPLVSLMSIKYSNYLCQYRLNLSL